MERNAAVKTVCSVMLMLVSAGAAFAQIPKQAPANSNSRKAIEAYASTNKTYARAMEYVIATLERHQPPELPKGVTEQDIANAMRIAFPNAELVFDKPIQFYGKVVDEKEEPVAKANFHFEIEDFLQRPRTIIDGTTDEAGRFWLTNRSGTQLHVSVRKDDYYTSGRNRGVDFFRYSVPYGEPFKPDPAQLVLYYLRKRGVAARSLITSTYGMQESFWVQVPRDGTKVKVDLLQRKTGDGQLEMSQVKPESRNWQTITNWSFAMTIPGGGFIEENEEWAFTPPESGYRSTVEFEFQKGLTNWATAVRQNYYIKFGNPPVYGQLCLETEMTRITTILSYVINPDGSRNLEPPPGFFPSSSRWPHM
jgi:hypothetical protein